MLERPIFHPVAGRPRADLAYSLEQPAAAPQLQEFAAGAAKRVRASGRAVLATRLGAHFGAGFAIAASIRSAGGSIVGSLLKSDCELVPFSHI